ncbi:hypothetical protein PPERSA_05278 [Pseudocohnilembus persalinus]|uniref:Uncharacterized protein n=1 Tax=Pseudocohnilembus persalinus TaxID=266149 RepID=A0A0V0R5X7_PSEPJ|nr:hypothetical protein PPERSA_05278 [Pseudocohnilembus persalinus]|eukprot:KRX09886.1 hypothetical protein PPERSA_05278 [Pseudocohnilembus persalinus]
MKPYKTPTLMSYGNSNNDILNSSVYSFSDILLLNDSYGQKIENIFVKESYIQLQNNYQGEQDLYQVQQLQEDKQDIDSLNIILNKLLNEEGKITFEQKKEIENLNQKIQEKENLVNQLNDYVSQLDKKVEEKQIQLQKIEKQTKEQNQILIQQNKNQTLPQNLLKQQNTTSITQSQKQPLQNIPQQVQYVQVHQKQQQQYEQKQQLSYTVDQYIDLYEIIKKDALKNNLPTILKKANWDKNFSSVLLETNPKLQPQGQPQGQPQDQVLYVLQQYKQDNKQYLSIVYKDILQNMFIDKIKDTEFTDKEQGRPYLTDIKEQFKNNKKYSYNQHSRMGPNFLTVIVYSLFVKFLYFQGHKVPYQITLGYLFKDIKYLFQKQGGWNSENLIQDGFQYLYKTNNTQQCNLWIKQLEIKIFTLLFLISLNIEDVNQNAQELIEYYYKKQRNPKINIQNVEQTYYEYIPPQNDETKLFEYNQQQNQEKCYLCCQLDQEKNNYFCIKCRGIMVKQHYRAQLQQYSKIQKNYNQNKDLILFLELFFHRNTHKSFFTQIAWIYTVSMLERFFRPPNNLQSQLVKDEHYKIQKLLFQIGKIYNHFGDSEQSGNREKIKQLKNPNKLKYFHLFLDSIENIIKIYSQNWNDMPTFFQQNLQKNKCPLDFFIDHCFTPCIDIEE